MTVSLQSDQGPFGCVDLFSFGPASEDFLELHLTEFGQFFGVVVEAGLVYFMYQFTLFHGLLFLGKYLSEKVIEIVTIVIDKKS